MKVRAGDLVSSSIAGDAVMTVPATSIELISGGVAGRCFKNAPVTALFRNAAGVFQPHLTSATDATGHWAVTVGLDAGWKVDAYYGNANGDAIRLQLVAS